MNTNFTTFQDNYESILAMEKDLLQKISTMPTNSAQMPKDSPKGKAKKKKTTTRKEKRSRCQNRTKCKHLLSGKCRFHHPKEEIPCVYFNRGSCKFGEKCKFRHVKVSLSKKKEPCTCRYGANCHFGPAKCKNARSTKQ